MNKSEITKNVMKNTANMVLQDALDILDILDLPDVSDVPDVSESWKSLEALFRLRFVISEAAY